MALKDTSRQLPRLLKAGTRSTLLVETIRPTPKLQAIALQSRSLTTGLRQNGSSSRPTLANISKGSLAVPVVPRRTLFIQTEPTPNADALKFKPNQRILPEEVKATFLEYLSPRDTLAAPHPSPLAGQLFSVDGITSVFYGSDYITVSKDSSADWAHVKPEVFSLITEAISSGQPFVKSVERGEGSGVGTADSSADSLSILDDDSETVQMIKELLETRVRPAIQEDGGDIEFRGFEDGWVKLKLRGACRTCDSSTVTLRNGIESMLQHYIEDVKGVDQVMDQEETIAMHEFAKFEEKLRQQKGPAEVAGTGGKGTLDTAEA
ncbi:MAG: hypothetical protein M1831_006874 [Alyxoria varia]|nr:MAG: hypothetical protein M1831_006874 [Alyxoria varia]